MPLVSAPTAVGVGALAVVVAAWSYVQGIIIRLRSMIIVEVIVTGPVASAVMAYVWSNFHRLPSGDRQYCSHRIHVRPNKRSEDIAYESPPTQPIIFFDRWRPLLASAAPKPEGNKSVACEGVFKFMYLRGTLDVDALILRALDAHNDKRCGTGVRTRYQVINMSGSVPSIRNGVQSYHSSPTTQEDHHFPLGHERVLRWTSAQLGEPITDRALQGLALTPGLSALIADFARWLTHEEWFRSRGVPCRALAQTHNLPIFSLDLASMSNQDLRGAWAQIMQSTPCVALIEDIDGVFHGRENVLNDKLGNSKLTFDCLLNCIGGVSDCGGVALFITTNHLDKVDPALGVPDATGKSSRPGRVDRLIEVTALDTEGRAAIARRILRDDATATRVAAATVGFTAAQVTELCIQRAFEQFNDTSVGADT
jgi:ATPase family associated with various cellular activities (AAA)